MRSVRQPQQSRTMMTSTMEMSMVIKMATMETSNTMTSKTGMEMSMANRTENMDRKMDSQIMGKNTAMKTSNKTGTDVPSPFS